MRLLVLPRYGRLGASSRLRMMQYLPQLEQAGFDITVSAMLGDDYVLDLYKRKVSLWRVARSYVQRFRSALSAGKFDVVWLEKEMFPWLPAWLDLALLPHKTRLVVDYDDAVFHRYDSHHSALVRAMLGRKIDAVMQRADLVLAGNEYLAARARAAGCRCVEVLPTVIDLVRYPSRLKNPMTGLPRILWIGAPSTVHYLELLREPLQALAKRYSFVLRVIGGGTLDLPGVQVEAVDWSEDTEVENIRACDVGVMPLLDSSWERGKCGYKLIQYMACSLPVVASNVGVNTEIVQQGENGFLANTPDEWVNALAKLLGDKILSAQMGLAGRQQVERMYCIQKTGARAVELLSSVVREH